MHDVQAEYEQYTIDQGREMEALHQQHKAESHVLKMRVQDLEASFADAGRDEEVSYTKRLLLCWLVFGPHRKAKRSSCHLGHVHSSHVYCLHSDSLSRQTLLL